MPMLAEAEARPYVTRFDPRAADFDCVGLNDLHALLMRTNGGEFFTLTALTVPDYYKRGCPFRDNLNKLARVKGQLNWDYARCVNNQREREGLARDFQSLPRGWGTHLNGTPFIAHVTKAGEAKLYVKTKVHTYLNVEYYNNDGERLATEDVMPWLKPDEYQSRQGVSNLVLERDYTVQNIISVVVQGRGYILVA